MCSQWDLPEDGGRSINFDRIATDTVDHYIDHERRVRAVQPIPRPPFGLDESDAGMYHFNGSDHFKIDSVQLRLGPPHGNRQQIQVDQVAVLQSVQLDSMFKTRKTIYPKERFEVIKQGFNPDRSVSEVA